jgi:signal transduction histidine kinase
MRASASCCSFSRWWLPILAVVAALGPAASARAQDRQKQVLILYSARRDAAVPVTGDRVLSEILDDQFDQRVDYYTEYIDFSRFPEAEYQSAFHDFLRTKYTGHRFDLLVAVEPFSLEFLEANRHELFPDVPLVFYVQTPPVRRPVNATGLVAEMHFGRSLTLATDLQPDVQHVFVISGASARDRFYESEARRQFRPFEPRLTFTYLSGLPADELERRVSTLPKQSIVYVTVVSQDRTGRNFVPMDYAKRMAVIANAPAYGWSSPQSGSGIVGGSLRHLEPTFEALGDLAVRVLRGERADSIPIVTVDETVSEVDWRQLRRWGISEARIPAGTRILYRQFTVWERYKAYILGALAILLAQSVLIIGLLVQRKRRRRAELESRQNLALAAQASRRVAVGALSGSIAHELNQPLSSILFNVVAAERLIAAGRGSPEELNPILHDIHAADVSASQIVQRQRAMLQKHELDKHPIDIHAVIRESLTTLAHEALMRQVSVIVEAEPGARFVGGDQVLLQQVVVNLVLNAIQAVADQPPNRRCVTVRIAVARGDVEVSVRDTGTGLPGDVAARLFEPFLTTKPDGVGIGLAIARTIVETHGGTITAENNGDGGATFRFTLPGRQTSESEVNHERDDSRERSDGR